MKKISLIGAVPTVTMAQSGANCRNTHTRVDRTHSLTHLYQHSTITVCKAPAQLLQNLELNFYFEGT